MWRELQLLLWALRDQTRAPVPLRWSGDPPEFRAASLRHRPAVGLLVGGFAALVLWAAAHAWPAPVAIVVTVAAMAWISRGAGGFDGAVAAGDGAAAPSRTLLLLVSLLALKTTALHGLATRDLLLTLAALPLAQTWARAAAVALLPRQRRAADAGGGLAMAMAALWAMLATAASAFFIAPQSLAAAALAVVVAVGAMALVTTAAPLHGRAWAASALEPIVEVAVYLGLLAALTRA